MLATSEGAFDARCVGLESLTERLESRVRGRSLNGGDRLRECSDDVADGGDRFGHGRLRAWWGRNQTIPLACSTDETDEIETRSRLKNELLLRLSLQMVAVD